jgi:hypothetical protein
VSALAARLDANHLPRDALRLLRVIAGVLVIALAVHHWGTELVSCLTGSPDPIVCNEPDVVLPHVDNERPAPGQVLDIPRITVVTSATSATPCFNPGPKNSPR